MPRRWGRSQDVTSDGARFTTAWLPGEVVVDRHAAPIMPGTLPGEYRLYVGLYDGASGQRATITGVQPEAQDGALLLRMIRVVAASSLDVSRLDFIGPAIVWLRASQFSAID